MMHVIWPASGISTIGQSRRTDSSGATYSLPHRVAVANDDFHRHANRLDLSFGHREFAKAVHARGGRGRLRVPACVPRSFAGAPLAASSPCRRGSPRDAVLVQDQELAGDHAAQRIADDIRLLDLQMIEQLPDVFHHLHAIRGLVFRRVRLAVAGQVQGDHAVMRGQEAEDAGQLPIDLGAGIQAVNEHDRLSLARHDIMDFTPPTLRV